MVMMMMDTLYAKRFSKHSAAWRSPAHKYKARMCTRPSISRDQNETETKRLKTVSIAYSDLYRWSCRPKMYTRVAARQTDIQFSHWLMLEYQLLGGIWLCRGRRWRQNVRHAAASRTSRCHQHCLLLGSYVYCFCCWRQASRLHASNADSAVVSEWALMSLVGWLMIRFLLMPAGSHPRAISA